MRIACVYWWCHSVGGIGTHLNNLRTAAIRAGDHMDILHSLPWKHRKPRILHNRKWTFGGDTKIWIDGEIPQTKEAARWLEDNYDAVMFGFICPNKTNRYPTPEFLYLYECKLPKIAWVMDGYWDDRPDWADGLTDKLEAVFCPLESYAKPVRESGVGNVIVSAFPFCPAVGKRERRSEHPSLIWPNQWKKIKGIDEFLEVVPHIPDGTSVELYSSGIRYYQLRETELWRNAVANDLYERGGYHGHGRANYYGNVDRPEIERAFQRAWYSVNLQGMRSKISTYQAGSYNNTEVEALYYGALPILHNSCLKTALPPSLYMTVSSPGELPDMVKDCNLTRYALDPLRQRLAREFVLDTHLAAHRYQDIKDVLEGR